MSYKILPQFHIQTAPIADPAAVVSDSHVRFTVLTSRLFRLEYSPSGQFEDRPSQAFWFRRQPVPKFQFKKTDEIIEIDTEYLHLIYRISEKGFTHNTLSIEVKTTGITWHYGDNYRRARNLMGTARTLDGINGRVDLGTGVNSRSGWAIMDDSKSLVFNSVSWLEPRDHADNLDLYCFGYGHDYIGAVHDFQKIAGETPFIPRYILGNWWSRYWAYSDTELKALMEDFQAHNVPLSVCIIDMDWHITKTGNAASGWTGYTWNRELIPDPPELIKWLHSRGLKTALNLHPADGVYPHEEQYPQFAEWMGIDPTTKEPVVFDISDPHFTEGYFNILHHPYEQMGIDFWWMDWQQGSFSRMPGLDPLWWINHLHFLDLGRDGRKRPFIFSRWGGLGNHRYPIGFSGDTVISWESLANQPAFTSAAANVGYGWWSHDIGGHMGGIEDDELYTRWIQYGVFSPILRMHCTNNPFHERRPWGRGPAAERAATSALRLRRQLIPYLYSMAWRNHREGIPLITPMYYTHPEEDGAYDSVWQEYWFGSELLAAPFIAPHDAETGLARQRVWLPEGNWFNFFTGEYVDGNGWQVVYGDLESIPVFARAGAIVPLDMNLGWSEVGNPASLEVHVFAGASNRFELFEDDGETNDYRTGKNAVTTFIQNWLGNQTTFTIDPVVGDTSVTPTCRDYRLVLHGIAYPATAELLLNGSPVKIEFTYDASAEKLSITPVTLMPEDQLVLTITAKGDSLLSKRDRRAETLHLALLSFKLDTWIKAGIARDLPALLAGEKTLLEYAGLKDAQISTLINLLRL
jgi:alpha-glucosidase (family GH31 glycosyl hydrolase)